MPAPFLRLLLIFMLPFGPASAAPVSSPTSLIDEAFQAAQWGFISSAGSAIRQMTRRRAAGNDAIADTLRNRQSLANLQQRTEARLAALAREGTPDQGDKVRLSGEIESLTAEIAALDRELAASDNDLARLINPQPLGIAQVQALLEPDEGLFLLFTGVNDSYGWAITATGAAWHRSGIGRQQIADQVTSIRAGLAQATALRSATPLGADFARPRVQPFDRTQAWLLYREQFAPLAPYLRDVRHLYTVVDGPMTGLPLSLLVTDLIEGADNDPETLRATPWLFQRYALTTLPSLDSLAMLRDGAKPDRSATYSFLGFGDPSLGGQATANSTRAVMRAGSPDVDAIRALAPLPNTARELRQIAATLKAPANRVYLGDAATETAVKSAPLAAADVIVFATHGLLSGDLDGLAEPALVLSPPDRATPGDDGLLMASEIAELDLNADWVVLSACNTAGSDGRPDAEGLSGLARAFLFAGARSVMVSHWPVRDDAAARLTTDTFAALNGPGGPGRKAQALQSAMQGLLDDTSDPSLAHPAAWAPFVLVGDGG